MKRIEIRRALVRACLASLIGLSSALCASPRHEPAAAASLWSRDNLFAWTVAPFDAKPRTPEERVEMLARLGFKTYAYSWRARHVPTFDAEMIALKAHGITLLGWNLLNNEIDDASALTVLETLKRHDLHPRLWVMQASRSPLSDPGFQRFLPEGFSMPRGEQEFLKLGDAERAAIQNAIIKSRYADLPKSPDEQISRVKAEADRIARIVKVASGYGCKVALYNHGGWFGMVENQVAIIERLKDMGITDVGMVYNFSHARDDYHDDTKNFPKLWEMMKPYVVAVNITGTAQEGHLIYPSQGDAELEMMRTIEASGWKGPIGLIAEKGGDAEITLRNYMVGLDWLAAELRQAGSGGPKPFASAP